MLYSSTLLAALAAPLLVSARPIRRASDNDKLVFQFANVLEQLESTFYAQGLQKFQESDFQNAGFSSALIATQTLTTIQSDEATHDSVIQSTLQSVGATPLQCNFKFDSVLTDVTTMAATARVVEYLGVTAYMGGATLIDDPVLLDAAASILTVEARHQTLLNILGGASSIPQAFDVALTPQEVLSIAGGFVDGPCDLGITPTNSLTVTNKNPQVGDLLNFQASNASTDGTFCNMITGGMPFAINLPISQCNIPPGVNGPVVVWLTKDDNPLINNVVDRDTIAQVAGPAIFFVDSQPEVLGQLVRNTGTGTSSGATTTTTTTISPDEASSITAAAATQTADSSSQTGTSSDGNGAAAPPPPSNGPSPNGPSPDGKTTVLGLQQVQRVDQPAVASASASGTDSASSPSSTDSANSASSTDSASSASGIDSASSTDSSTASATDSAATPSGSSITF